MPPPPPTVATTPCPRLLNLSVNSIKQGDLTDPDYFDFISFAQHATLAIAMRNGRQIFEEKVGAEGEKRTVQRDHELRDNGRLPEEHARRVGDRILVSGGAMGMHVCRLALSWRIRKSKMSKIKLDAKLNK